MKDTKLEIYQVGEGCEKLLCSLEADIVLHIAIIELTMETVIIILCLGEQKKEYKDKNESITTGGFWFVAC